MNYLEFQVLWIDDDSMLQLGVRAANSFHAMHQEVYVYPEALEEFAAGLKEFPRDGAHEVGLRSGSKDPQWYGYLRMRLFLLKPTGLSALEIESEVRLAPPLRAEAHFFIPGLPADFNRIGSELNGWLSDTTRPFRIEWSDDV